VHHFVATIAFPHNTTFIKFEFIVDAEIDTHWLLSDSLYHLVHRVLDPVLIVEVAHDLVEIMVTSAKLSCSILVVRVSHGTLVYEEFVVIPRIAAVTAPAIVVFVTSRRIFEFSFVVATTSIAD